MRSVLDIYLSTNVLSDMFVVELEKIARRRLKIQVRLFPTFLTEKENDSYVYMSRTDPK